MSSLRLPPEIWGLVIDLLQHRDQRSCLSVSRLHHDIALPHVFSRVRVVFGLWVWRPRGSAREWGPPGRFEHNRMARRGRNTFDILRAIASRPDFAKVVTEFTVHACAWAWTFVESEVQEKVDENSFERRQEHLIAALKALPKLRVFRWCGQRPNPPSAIFAALRTGSLTSLTEIHIPMLEDIGDALPQIYGFSSLQCLSLVRQGSSDGPGHNVSGDLEVADLPLDLQIRGLTHLSITGDIVWRRESFSGLQELELIYTASFAGFADILRHCAALTSLTLVPYCSADPAELFAALNSNPNALSNLSAFKYQYLWATGTITAAYEQIEALCEFLKGKRHLRKLDVACNGTLNQEEDMFLGLLPELPALEVLGFNFFREYWGPEDIAFFRRVIPSRLTAFRVGHFVVIDQQSTCESYRAEWLTLLKSLTSLRYLHIFESYYSDDEPDPDTGLRLRELPVEELPSSLELYGYGLYMHSVVRDPGNADGESEDNNDTGAARATFSPCWSAEKIAFRTKEDFGCADWEWLLRWHDYRGLGTLPPGVLHLDSPFKVTDLLQMSVS